MEKIKNIFTNFGLSILRWFLLKLNISIIINVDIINEDGDVDINFLKDNGIWSNSHVKDCLIRSKDGEGFYGTGK